MKTQKDAVRGREDGMTKVESNHADWVQRAKIVLEAHLRTAGMFHCDDFWELKLIERPYSMRALGPVISHASRQGWMEKSGEYRPSNHSNMSAKPVWRSLIMNKLS